MRILGVDLTRDPPSGAAEHTLVSLDDAGRVASILRAPSLPAVAAAVAQLAAGEPFVLGVNVPVVAQAKPARARRVEILVQRRLGTRLPAWSRTTSGGARGAGDALLAGLATAGAPCLPYPDRDRRKSGLAETYPELSLKALLWESSPLATPETARVQELLRAFTVPPYRRARLPARVGWVGQATALDLALRLVRPLEGFDVASVSAELSLAAGPAEVERAAALLDAVLIAGTARRYLDAPDASLFVGDVESGYVILPADGRVRRVLAADTRPRPAQLFPRASIQERLGPEVRVQPVDLLPIPGRPQPFEATFPHEPQYEFDNVDEMVWWKHCRHLGGPLLPTEGLRELAVRLAHADAAGTLRLLRSRHRTPSFRFDPPKAWRQLVPTRDGRTYVFRVVRAVFDTLGGKD